MNDTNRLGVVLAVLGLSAIVILLCAGLGGMFVLPAFRTARESAHRELARNNLKQLEMALRNYHADLTAHKLNEEQEEEEDEEASDAEEKTTTDPPFVSNAEIERLANQYKAKWMVTQADVTFEGATVFETRQTDQGWRVTFQSVAQAGQIEISTPQFLHVLIDKDGKLVKIERDAS